jgi:hypothetical protein
MIIYFSALGEDFYWNIIIDIRNGCCRLPPMEDLLLNVARNGTEAK